MKILFIPMDGTGHVNACLGLARMLRGFGHECIFSLSDKWVALTKGHNFAVETFPDPDTESGEGPSKWANFLATIADVFAKDPKSQWTEFIVPSNQDHCEAVQNVDNYYAEAISKVNPDLIIIDFYVTVPSVVLSGKPWCLLLSCSPIRVYKNGRPHHFGLKAEDKEMFQSVRELQIQSMSGIKASFDVWLLSKGVTPDPTHLWSPSPYLGLYSYPADIDYSEYGPVPDKWFRLDHMVRGYDDFPLGFDESFFNLPDKKIFFSLGSMGGANVKLMNKLINFMSKSKYKFIVSKGPFPDQIDLASNMVGDKYINQMTILPKVDLVITHGGNNTFVETLYFGKPMIVMPLFGDQHDNGRRAEEKKIGRCLYPHKVTEEELLTVIDEILNDSELIARVVKIGENIRNSKSHSNLNDKLFEIINKKHV